MALPKLESFTNANGTPLATHNASWVYARSSGSPSAQIDGNALHATAGFSSIHCWTGDAFSADQYAQAVASLVSGADFQGPSVRLAAAADQGYTIDTANGDRSMESMPGFAALFHDTGAIANGDVQRIEASSNSITYKMNGATLSTVTDNTTATGAAGLLVWGAGGYRLDDWEGGNLGVAAQDTPELYGRPRGLSGQRQTVQLLAQ